MSYNGSRDFKGDRVLTATVYHFIKNNPQHWNQKHWVCGTGMCYAGWYAYIHDMNVETHVNPVHENMCHVKVGDDYEFIGDYVAKLMGFCDESHFIWACNHKSLFYGHNDLEDIRKILTGLMGEDPEDIEPDNELLNFGKKVKLLKFGHE